MGESPEFTLIGIADHFNSRKEVNNYVQVKGFLERTNPGFVTAEVKLHNEVPIRMLGQRLFTNNIEGLKEIDDSCAREARDGGEYVAAIIFCRRNNIPL